MKDYERDRKGEIEVPEEPSPPPTLKIFFPANISNSAMKKLLNENCGRGIIFETEGDTLANILKQEYGNYSDDLRKAFHHENISFFRKTNTEDIEITSPKLSVVLSSTFGQLLRLIPNAENGLFSRFCYYQIDGDSTFKNPFDKSKNNQQQFFNEYSNRFLKIYEKLEQLENPISFELSENQKKRFLAVFQTWKHEIREYVSKELDGTVHRLGLIGFRICMILSSLRQFGKNCFDQKIICTDQDFDNGLSILEVFKWHALELFDRLPQPPTECIGKPKKRGITNEQRQLCKELIKEGISYGEASKIVFGSVKNKSSVWRCVNEQS